MFDDQEEDGVQPQKEEPDYRPRIMTDDVKDNFCVVVEAEVGAGAHMNVNRLREDRGGVTGMGIASSAGDSAEAELSILRRPTGSIDSNNSDTPDTDVMGVSPESKW